MNYDSPIQSHAPNAAEKTGGDGQSQRAFFRLTAGDAMVAIEAEQGSRPFMLYAGPLLEGVDPEEIALLSTRQHAPGSSTVPLRGSLLNELGTGIAGPSGLIAHRAGEDWAIDLRVTNVAQPAPNALVINCKDAHTQITAQHTLSLDPETGMLVCSTTITNDAPAQLELDWCASMCVPTDPDLTRFLSFTGKWAHEFAIEEVPAFHGSIVRENKSGRTSHTVFPGGILAAPDTTETGGRALGFHLAWSGNHRLRIDRHNDGNCVLQMGEMTFPGEIQLAQGESYSTPDLLVCFSQDGLNSLSEAFHTYLTETVMEPRIKAKPRPVHFNTWEAVYFNHKQDALFDLAHEAAKVGAERFVLDDGWFGSRRHDGAGLGDWWVSPDVYPGGLEPLANKVRELGMEFGLWFEPEMVNPDSDLYREHPDWVLGAPGVEDVPFRGQLTLDLTKPPVFQYLYEKISALVADLGIAYIKWDMNRDTNHPGSDGRAAMHRQTKAVYRLIAELRAAHPQLEIESCSSGGARADFGILRHTDRIWTSDNNDARQRQHIMRGASHFFPLKVLGNHVGPRRCHITGREFSMAFRVGSALLGSMGMELDLRDESDADRATLKAGIALYKQHRDLIHSGKFLRLESTPSSNLTGCVARDGCRAIFSYARLDTELSQNPKRIRFAGLNDAKKYRVRLIWPQHNPSISWPSIIDKADLMGDGHVFSGSALMGHGIQPPLTFPDTCLIYHLEAQQ